MSDNDGGNRASESGQALALFGLEPLDKQVPPSFSTLLIFPGDDRARHWYCSGECYAIDLPKMVRLAQFAGAQLVRRIEVADAPPDSQDCAVCGAPV